MDTPNIVFRRKGTRVIYPYTEANAKNPSLIAMTIEEAREEGLLEPQQAKPENSEIEELKAQNAELLKKLSEMQQNTAEPDQEEVVEEPSPTPVKKKRATKKAAPVTIEKNVAPPSDGDGKQFTLEDIGM